LDVRQETGGSYLLEIFVADNRSTADQRLQLQQSLVGLPRVHVKMNSENLGFAAGHNGNIRTILTQFEPDYIWVLNDDCLVNEDAALALVKCAQQHPNVGIWGATLIEPDGETIQCAGGCLYNSWVSSYRQHGQGTSLAQINQLKSIDLDYIAGASLFFPVNALENGLRAATAMSIDEGGNKQQWLNESFFLYFEELDIAHRLKPGFGMAWCRAALIRHVGGASTGSSEGQRTALAEYYSTLSALKFTKMYYPQRLWFMAPVRYLSKCLQLTLKGKVQLIKPLTQAYRDFWGECV